MSAVDDIEYVRLFIDDVTEPHTYTDGQVLALIRRTTTVMGAVALAWAVKAGSYVELIDATESGADRKLSQMHAHAMEQAAFFHEEAVHEIAAISKGIRIGPQAGLPWGRGVVNYRRAMETLSYLIGDYSRGPSGGLLFIEIPVPATGTVPVDSVETFVSGDSWDITIVQGVTWIFTSTYREPGGALVDLDGYHARFVLNPESPVVILTDGAGITLGGASGTVSAELTDVQTAALNEGMYEYRLTLTSPDGTVLPYLSGLAEVSGA